MPTISMFFGILIRMFFRDIEKHHVPHIHADYQGEVAVYSILDGTLLAGEFPPNKQKLVVAWIEIHKEDLLADWNLAVNGKKPVTIQLVDEKRSHSPARNCLAVLQMRESGLRAILGYASRPLTKQMRYCWTVTETFPNQRA